MKYLVLIACVSISTLTFSQWNVVNYMSEPKVQFSVTVWGDDIWFIGGNNGTSMSADIDVYDTKNNTFKLPLSLSLARAFANAVSGDSAIYIAGGAINYNFDGSDIIDIYKDGQWAQHFLPDSVFFLYGVKVGSKILFLGGAKKVNTSNSLLEISPYITMYDELTGIWSIDSMAVPRTDMAIATDGTIAMFAGGLTDLNVVSDRIDIYNSSTDTWTTMNFPTEPRSGAIGAYANGKFIFAGGGGAGNTPKNRVDIYDGTNWTTATLHEARSNPVAAITDNKIYFTAGGPIDNQIWSFTASSDVVDVYDISSETWTYNFLNESRMNHVAIGIGTKAYVAGGASIGSGSSIHDDIVVIDDFVGLFELGLNEFKIFPNPVSTNLSIKGLEKYEGPISLQIVNNEGSLVKKLANAEDILDVSDLTPGLYSIIIQSSTINEVHMFVKK